MSGWLPRPVQNINVMGSAGVATVPVWVSVFFVRLNAQSCGPEHKFVHESAKW